MAIMMMVVIQNFDYMITIMLMMQENKDNSMYRPNNGDHDDNDKVKYRLLRLLEHLRKYSPKTNENFS